MNEYRAQKDKLETEAMKRNPETAYLVDKETFDNRLDELGAFDAIEACGMYVDRAMYNMKRAVQNFFRELLELLFNAAALVIDTLRTFFRSCFRYSVRFLCHLLLGRFPGFSQPVVRRLHQYLPVASVSDLFSSVAARIQILMLQRDIEQLSDRISSPTAQTGFTSLSSLSASSGISPSRPYRTGLCRPEAVRAIMERT